MGVVDLGWHERTKFRVGPGFYNVEVSVIFSLGAWHAVLEASPKHGLKLRELFAPK